MTTWELWSWPDGTYWARRTDRTITQTDRDNGLTEYVDARTAVERKRLIDEQDALERELQERT